MESPLSQESIHIPEKDIRCRTEVIDRAHHVEVNSSIQVNSSKLIVHDLQLRKVITSPSELRFGCSGTLWKENGVKNPSIGSFISLELILVPENRKNSRHYKYHSYSLYECLL